MISHSDQKVFLELIRMLGIWKFSHDFGEVATTSEELRHVILIDEDLISPQNSECKVDGLIRTDCCLGASNFSDL